MNELRDKFLFYSINGIKTEILKNKTKRLRTIYKFLKLKNLIAENEEKFSAVSTLPLLVANVCEIFVKKNIFFQTKLDGIVLKTSNKSVIFVKNSGFLNSNSICINNLIAVNKDSYFIVCKLPIQYDHKVKVMEIETKPVQAYHDIGGLDVQIQELIEAVVFPTIHVEQFKKLGISPPKGVLLHGPPGLGKTLLARACASQTNAFFLKLAGPQLVQMYIGEGASLIREAFALAKEKQPSIIFIDEIDAIGTTRFDSSTNGDREVQRTMLELLNQLDGFSQSSNIRVIIATNRIDTLDPALLRSGRIDRKIEFPYPDKNARKKIIQIHIRKLKISDDIELDDISSLSSGFNGAQLKTICTEAGMNAIRRNQKKISQEDFLEALFQIKIKKKIPSCYYF